MATNEANKIATSQIALPKDACDAVYATDGYDQSVSNLTQVSLAPTTSSATMARRSSSAR